MKYMKIITIAVALFAPTVSFASGRDVCSDAYLSAAIQPEANRAQRAVGICGTAKAAISLYSASIRLVSKCQHDPGLRAYKKQLEQSLQEARNQASSSCG
ncbi:hypothetical protein [Agrobacterium larrymoorei]|uniref:Uncharacterized protein n=1 Tax=Agrobacterium larrymoorei TaxID=160699 RepID=A0A4D7DMQ1_9HYPH|nr:hypothetical protein [Agrobacterium larrymoorei]QCI98195.1 hypothetical protein CFBP5473_09915 [Agrobacterium larrymoorei]QYA06351.1 hypothetical protein J5285_09795 [Agrobacterium larrymoorei]